MIAKQKNKKQKTLEERTNIKLADIEALMETTNSTYINLSWTKPQDHFRAIYSQNIALYGQNKIIIDYLQEIYKAQTGEQK